MVHITNIADIDFDSLVYSQPKTNASGGQTIFINTKTLSKRLVITLPRCHLPFGVSDYNGRKSLQFSLKGDSEKMHQYKNFLTTLDLKNVQTGVNNSVKWFKKALTPEIIQNLYNPSMKQTNDAYPPMFRSRLPTHQDTGKFVGDIFDANKRLVTQESITPGCEVEAIVELVGIYFVAKEFGVSWKVVQLKVFPSERLKGYSFLCDSDDETSDAEPN
jgi:hypothetical protein